MDSSQLRSDMALNVPRIVEEVTAQFEAYERALAANDVEALDGFFWASEDAIRLGTHENLYGARAISRYRRSVPPGRWSRTLMNTIIVTFGENAASISTEFTQPGGVAGRQSEMWVRLSEGWRIVSAHVSLIAQG